MEHKIIEAAKATFLKKGYKDTNMADIAAEVGLTRPAMHYYFRTKERLFQAVFGDILMSFIPQIKESLSADIPLELKISQIVEAYMSVLEDSPTLPVFIVQEINRDIDNIISIALDNNLVELGQSVVNVLNREMEEGRIRKMPLIELGYTFYGLMMVPFLARPAGQMIFGRDSYSPEFLQEWKENVIRQMVYLLKPQNE
ncbi:MAG: TetR/AcrR family transcriptional regulator [Bacteroidales bacterium]|nr:TetR/AcrR family transcriptional regulator [Bacteroidales bacterium]